MEIISCEPKMKWPRSIKPFAIARTGDTPDLAIERTMITKREEQAVMRTIKMSVLGIAIGLALTTWTFDFIASAHEGHKHSHAPASAKKLKNPLTATDENIAAGRVLFNKNCATCHGEDGKAKTDVAKAMKVKPTDLT